jgi:hypothetical protein
MVKKKYIVILDTERLFHYLQLGAIFHVTLNIERN